nr:hypothetical protein Iba_chr04aCG24410 [Ipomoea batatas]
MVQRLNKGERSWTTFGCRNDFTELRKCHPFAFVKSTTPQPDVTCTLTDLDLISAAKSTIPPSPAPLQRAETKFTSDCFSSFSSDSDFLALLLEYLNKDRNHAVLLWQFGAGFRRKEPERPSRASVCNQRQGVGCWLLGFARKFMRDEIPSSAVAGGDEPLPRNDLDCLGDAAGPLACLAIPRVPFRKAAYESHLRVIAWLGFCWDLVLEINFYECTGLIPRHGSGEECAYKKS